MRRRIVAWQWIGLLCAMAALGQKDPESRASNQPVEPFRIAGNIYYVGASDVTSYLIVTPKGHILLDGGFEETVPIIRANIDKLGFKLSDVKILLCNHAHYDHVGGIAELKRLTGATFYASAGDTPVLTRGGNDDPQFGNTLTFPAVTPDRLVHDGQLITLGGTTLVAHLTPGHTQGATTWTTRVRDSGKTYDVVFATSLSTPSFKLVGNKKYPTIAHDYRATFAKMRKLPCDIFLSSHGSIFQLTEKAEKARKGDRKAFIDPAGYKQYVDEMEKAFEKKLAEQSAK